MSAKTFAKICWFVLLLVAISVVLASLGSDSYSLRADEELNIRISPLKRISVIQLVETEEERPVEYHFVNSKESFEIYSYTVHSEVYDSAQAFGGAQEVNFRATYDEVFGVDDAISGTTVGIRSSYPIGVEIEPEGTDIVALCLVLFWLGCISGGIVFSPVKERF